MINHVSHNLDSNVTAISFITDEDGFLLNPDDWQQAFAENVLELAPGELSAEHIKVINFVRDRFLRLEALPPMRQVCKSTGLNKLDLNRIFGSCLQLWQAAGLPNPDDEVRSHMN